MLLLNAGLFAKINAQCASSTNIYSFNYAGKSYEIVKELKTWTQASQCAVERGGYLVQIESLEEQNAIYDAIKASGISSSYKAINDGGGTSYIWIGASDINTEGTWLWDENNDGSGLDFWNGQGAAGANDGKVVAGKYVNWGGKSKGTYQEPDNYNSNQDAAAIALAGWPSGTTDLGIAGEWNDINSINSIYYIIEYNSIKTGINNSENDDDLKIYPNQANSKFDIYTNITSVNKPNLKIYNINGVLIQSLDFQSYNSTIIDLTGNPKGIYILKIQINNDIIIKKVLLDN